MLGTVTAQVVFPLNEVVMLSAVKSSVSVEGDFHFVGSTKFYFCGLILGSAWYISG